MTKLILKAIHSCDECPAYEFNYYEKLGFCNEIEKVLESEEIPSDCPLPDKEDDSE